MTCPRCLLAALNLRRLLAALNLRRLLAALACVAVLALAGTMPAAAADKRLALVIGNSAYRNAPPLKNPANDAADIAAALERLGFEVIRGVDLDYMGMRSMVRQFSDKLADARVALLYYAGHGVQVAGKNYLIPVDGKLDNQADLDFGTIDLDLILRGMEAETRTNIIFLDACRDNPLAARLSGRLGTRSASLSRGLAQVESSVGTLIAFATQPGNIAFDGEGRNSPFTAALLKTIEIPGLPLSDVMIGVRNEVLRTTERKQVPWDNSSLTGQFYFKPLPADAATAQPGSEGVEIAFWNSIRDSKNPQLFEAYLRRYPNGSFTDIAKINLEQFKVAVAKPLAPMPEQKVALYDPGLLREVRDRLYELNFDPTGPDTAGLKVAITEFESQSGLQRTGEATRGLLSRLREIGGLKPWGAIVYDKDAGKWGMAWDDPARKSAVARARENCAGAKCPIELSFFGTSCGAFALSSAGFSIVSRDDIQRARQAALDECNRRGRPCRIIGASCADGTGRSSN